MNGVINIGVEMSAASEGGVIGIVGSMKHR
jgi:hypothetical protein